MFNKQEIKEFLIKYGKKWFFPDFSNKITWFVITLGAGIILTPIPIKIVVYNWLIDTFNLNSSKYLTLSDLGNRNEDYIVGFALIFLALSHNLISKWLTIERQNTEVIRKREQISKWRKMIIEVHKGRPNSSLQTHPDYLSLEPLLKKEVNNKVYGENRVFMYGSDLQSPLREIKDEITRIEKEWRVN